MSNADELLKYKELLDSEIITQEEFEKKKRELLNTKTINTTTVKQQTQTQNRSQNINIHNQKNNSSNGFLIAFCIVIPIIAFIAFFGTIIMGSLSTTTESIKIRTFLVEEYNLSEEEAENVINIIDECGYSEYYSNYTLSKGINNENIEGSQGIEIMKNGNTIGFADIKDGVVCLVQYSDKVLYENGEIKHTLSEYIVDSKEKEDLILKTKNGINAILKSPTTAKYPWDYSEWKVGKKDGSTIVQSYVDSQNSFGATVRSTFQVTYTNGIVTSLIFDGKEYIK